MVMRLSCVAFLTLLAAPAFAEMVALPKGGQDVSLPGFSVRSPGKPWLMLDGLPNQTKDHSVRGEFKTIFGTGAAASGGPLAGLFGARNDSTSIVEIGAFVAPVEARDPQALMALLKGHMQKRIDVEATERSRLTLLWSNISDATVNGASCVRWEAVYEDRGVPHHENEAFTLTMHRLMCSHPEFPAFLVRIDFSTRLAPGTKPFVPESDGLGVLDSLKFTHLGFRVNVIPVGDTPQFLTEADGSVWVAYGGDDGKVARIDPKTRAVTATIPVGKTPVGITADASGVWVANVDGDTVSRIDAKTNKVVATIPTPRRPAVILSGAGSIWVTASGAGSVLRIHPENNSVVEIHGAGKEPTGMTFADGLIYVTDYQSDRIARIDPATNSVSGKLSGAKFSNYILSDGRYLWLNHQGKTPSVLRLDPAVPDAAPVVFTKSLDYKPTGMASWRDRLWVANWAGATISRLDPRSPDAAGEFLPVGYAPFGILAAQGALWVTVLGINAVVRLAPDR